MNTATVTHTAPHPDALTQLAAAIEALESIRSRMIDARVAATPHLDAMEAQIDRLHEAFRLLTAEAKLNRLLSDGRREWH